MGVRIHQNDVASHMRVSRNGLFVMDVLIGPGADGAIQLPFAIDREGALLIEKPGPVVVRIEKPWRIEWSSFPLDEPS